MKYAGYPAFLTSLQWCRCAEGKRRCIRILQVQPSKADAPLEACPQGKVPFVTIIFHCGKKIHHKLFINFI